MNGSEKIKIYSIYLMYQKEILDQGCQNSSTILNDKLIKIVKPKMQQFKVSKS